MLRYKAEKLASQFPSIVVEAEKIAATLIQGLHGRYRSGHGETFWQFRHYNQEDTPNKIDWRRSAKSEELFLRETETEVPQSLWIWCDHSPSMTYRSDSNLLIKKEVLPNNDKQFYIDYHLLKKTIDTMKEYDNPEKDPA